MSDKQQNTETEKSELLSDLELANDAADQTTAGAETVARSSGLSAGKVSMHDLG